MPPSSGINRSFLDFAAYRSEETAMGEDSPVPGVGVAPYFWMLAGSFSFALMGTLVHLLGQTCDWQVIALVRAFLALLMAALLAKAAGARLVIWRPATLWVRSIAGSLSLVGTFYALTRLPVADVLTLTNTFPLWVAILSWPVLKEPPSGKLWLAVLVSILGVVLIQRPHLAEGNFATLIALASSFTTAVAMIGLHHLDRIDPRAIVVHFSGVSMVFCAAALVLFERVASFSLVPQGKDLLALFGVGVTATIGQLFLTKAFVAGTPAKVAVVGLTQVIFAMLFDERLWEQSLIWPTLAGMALVLAPTTWVMTGRQ
jgi:drug/metabolite transporter (DMT)-like permease